MTVSTAAPDTRRIIGIDLARTFALVGMITAHIYGIYRPDHEDSVAFQIVAGRSAALFAVLAGVAVAIVTAPGRRDPGLHRPALLIRAGWVVAIGMVLGAFDSGLAIILVNYGLLFLLALPFIRWRASWLAGLAVLWAVASPVVSHLLRPHLPDPALQVPSPLALLEPVTLVTEVLVTGFYPVLTWGTYLFAGMAVGRLSLRSTKVALFLAMLGSAVALFAFSIGRWVASTEAARVALVQDSADIWWAPTQTWEQLEGALRQGLYGVAPTDTWWWLGVWTPHSGTIVDLIHTTGTALAVIGFCLLAVQLTGRTPGLRRAWQIISGAGAMTLTLYSAHALTLALPDGTWGTDLWSVHVGAALLIGAVFAALRRRGPLESLVSVTSAEIAPLFRSGHSREPR